MGNILVVSPTWVGIHLDIIRELERHGYNVEFLSEYSFKKDPLKVKRGWAVFSHEKADRVKSQHWKEQLSKTKTVFDYLLVIDGQGVNHYLFEELKKRNSNIVCINYLYDTTYGFYHFEYCFRFYDKVYSFDKKDASLNNINFLPIYWIENEIKSKEKEAFNIFGFGSYSESRYRLYSQVKNIAEDKNMSCFIKMYYPRINNRFAYLLKNFLKRIVGKPYNSIPSQIYKSDIITNTFISTDDYRSLLYAADIVLDTKVQSQDGLTARFMWALGAGKKIITTNNAVKTYSFYNPSNILVVRDKEFNDSEKNEIRTFLSNGRQLSKVSNEDVICYRLDNWIKTVLGV